jgi:transposase
MTRYPESIEQEMRKFYNTLSEKDRRRYAAVEAGKLGHGGISYVAEMLGCARSTIATGLQELASLPVASGYERRIRRVGGGRKPYAEAIADIDAAFLDVVQDHTAGDPMQTEVLWTNLTQAEICQRLGERHGIQVSETVVRQLLEKHHFKRRKAQKK